MQTFDSVWFRCQRDGSSAKHVRDTVQYLLKRVDRKISLHFPSSSSSSFLNRPLHLIVGYPKPISDFVTLHSIIMT